MVDDQALLGVAYFKYLVHRWRTKMIPFNKPYLTGRELVYLGEALQQRKMSGDGMFSKKVHAFIESNFKAKKALLTTSGTDALEMAALLIDLKPGDEVILPSYTFVSTANAVMLRGARPVFADIREDTLNIDPAEVARKITPRTKAIIPVHYAGVACDMDALMKIADAHRLFVIEDAAQAVNARYHEQYLGTIGHIGCYSFHETKNYVAGEGGALLVNVADEDMIRKAEIIREKGTNRSQFFRGEVDKYTWVDLGSSFLPSDLLAAVLLAQLEAKDTIQDMRRAVFERYQSNLRPLEEAGFLRLPVIPEGCEINYHMFYIILNSNQERDSVMDTLKNSGVGAVFHYIPLHSSPMGKALGYLPSDLPKTEELSGRLLRLPIFPELKTEEIDKATEIIQNIFQPNKISAGKR
jgi:dTDP-4-amino-4,6-dideoxygalactose transaminase